MTQTMINDDECPICGGHGYYAWSERESVTSTEWFDHYHGPCGHDWNVPSDGAGLEEFDENEGASLEGACPSCGHFGVNYEPDTQRPCGCPDTERVICAHCGEYLGLAQYDPCDCAEWTCEGDDALAYEEWDGEL